MSLIAQIKTQSAQAYSEALNEAVKHLIFTRSKVGSGHGEISRIRTSNVYPIAHDSTVHTMCVHIFSEALTKYVSTLIHKPSIRSNEGFQLLRYQRGQKYGVHVDEGPESPRRVSAILYLNDNYKGGELHFPLQKRKIKAQAGSVLLFPSNYAFPHASLPIKSGNKYSIVTWFY